MYSSYLCLLYTSESLRFALRKDYDLFFATNISDALSIYGAQEISVIVLDLKLGNENGMDLYHKLKEINPEVVVIIITAFGTIESSVEAIKSGIFQYLTKPIDLEDLRFSLSKAVEMDKLHRRVKFAEDDKLKSLENYGLLFYSDKMNGIMHTVNTVSYTHLDVYKRQSHYRARPAPKAHGHQVAAYRFAPQCSSSRASDDCRRPPRWRSEVRR